MKKAQPLKVEAHQKGWFAQTLTANEGKEHRDFFVRGLTSIEVRYNPRGAVVEATRHHQRLGQALHEHIGPKTAGKRGKVLEWIKSPSQMGDK